MATVEVITYGGGVYVNQVLNAVAAWSGAGGYASMIQVVMVLGLIMSTLIVAFNMNVKAWLNWFLVSTLIYMALMVPKVDVVITDRIASSLPTSSVGNVPLGLGVLASFSSQVGDYLTQSSETVFGMPAGVRYSDGGMVWGSRLLEAARQVRVQDPEFAANLDEHFKMCVFYDIALGHKSMENVGKAGDLWASIGPGSPARAQRFLTRDGGTGVVTADIRTCQAAYTALDAQWSGMLDALKFPLSGLMYPDVDPATALSRFEAHLPSAHQYLMGVSKSASDTMKQALLINAMKQATHTASGGSTVDVYAQTRAEIQTETTYNSIAATAMKWVPVLHIILTSLFYAMFPILFPLFLLPGGGVMALKGYVTGFFYLAAWGPLFVILHMIMMTRASDTGTLLGGGLGMTLANSSGVAGIAEDVSTLAGYMIATIPFLAAGISKGAMAIGGQAASFLAPSQGAASEAGREAATGNIAFGNTSFETSAFNNRTGNQWNTAPSYTGGAGFSSIRQENGQMAGSAFDGTNVIDTRGAISNLPFTPQLSSELRGQLSTSAANSFSAGERVSNSASEAFGSTMSKFSDFRRSVSEGNTLETAFGASDQSNITRGFSEIDQASKTLQERFGLSKQRADSEATSAFLGLDSSLGSGRNRAGGGEEGGGGRGPAVSFGSNGGIKRSATATGTDTVDQNLSDARSYLKQQSDSRGWNESSEAFMRSSASSSRADVASRVDGMSSALNESRTLSRDASRFYEEGHRLERAASLTDSNGVSVSENLSQEFVNYVQGEQQRLAQTGITPAWNPTRNMPQTREEHAEKDFYMDRFVGMKAEQIRLGVEPTMEQPTAAGIIYPSVNTQAGVAAVHRQQNGRVPTADGHADQRLRSPNELGSIRETRQESVEAGGGYVGRRVEHERDVGENIGSAVRSDDRLKRPGERD